MFITVVSTKIMFFIAVAHMLSLLWKIKVSIDIMGKVKVGLYFYLTADNIMTKVLQKCSLSSPLPNIRILSKLLNLIGCHGNRNAKLAKKYWTLFWGRMMGLIVSVPDHCLSFYFVMYVLYLELYRDPGWRLYSARLLNPSVVYTTDRSEAVVPMLFLFCVAL